MSKGWFIISLFNGTSTGSGIKLIRSGTLTEYLLYLFKEISQPAQAQAQSNQKPASVI